MVYTFFSLFGNWSMLPDERSVLAQADAIVVYSFGSTQKANRSTWQLMVIAIFYAEVYNIPLICHYPSHLVAQKRGIEPIRILVGENADLAINDINRQVVQMAINHKWRNIMVVAHPHQVWRVAKNLKKQNESLIIVVPKTDHVNYDPKSSLPTFRSARSYVPRELFERIHYWWKGLL